MSIKVETPAALSPSGITVDGWSGTGSGWWTKSWGAYARWRRARQDYVCSECHALIPRGAQYVVSRITPWSDCWDSFWSLPHCGECRPEWNPPS